jgi:hypothetical protein
MEKTKNLWRVNYTVTYRNKLSADVYRKPVLGILHGVALVRGIECEITYDYPFEFEPGKKEYTYLKDSLSDLVYFRSSEKTKIRAADFRKMIDLVFEEQQSLLGDYPFEVGSQMQQYLHLYPFPVK